jgi:hypothetical protein
MRRLHLIAIGAGLSPQASECPPGKNMDLDDQITKNLLE